MPRNSWKSRFSSKKSSKWFQKRIIAVGGRPFSGSTMVDDDTQMEFCSNHIRSSKYTLLSFWVLNPFEQFRRMANFTYLMMAVVQMFLPEPPVSPMTTIFPLAFVVVVSMVKQGYEDILRHKNDNTINKADVKIVRKGKIIYIRSQDIQVGDIVMVRNNEDFPCDLLILSTSSMKGKCYVMTANLDGETNLKPLTAPKDTKKFMTANFISGLEAQIECQNPNPDLHNFHGRIKVKSGFGIELSSLGLTNIAMRGTQLKNTDFIFGCAVYTGRDTKMSQNSKLTYNKFSSVEKTMNICFVVYLFILLFEVIICTIFEYYYGLDFQYETFSEDERPEHWYLGSFRRKSFTNIINDAVSYLILFSYIIPISLYVTLELQRVFSSVFFTWDIDLYNKETDEPAMVNSSDLNEELGQINILFSDKTGTLTENVMIFKEASIGGLKYSMGDLSFRRIGRCSFSDISCQRGNDETGSRESFRDQKEEKKIHQFLMALSLCHTVQVAKKESTNNNGTLNGCDNESYMADDDDLDSQSFRHIEYNASSPDEKAILEACNTLGMRYVGEDELKGYCKILDCRATSPQIKMYKKLYILEFDSIRKRMSIIVKHPNGKIYLITKGAESSVIPRCVNGPTYETNRHIDDYALVGLRTLAVAIKELSELDLHNFENIYHQANQSIEDRDTKLLSVFDMVENNLVLLGATAVEDKLQEGVKETLINLGWAGITVWILTGDKKETAINISYSCGHLLPDMTVLDITSLTNITVTHKLHGYLDHIEHMSDVFGLVVDGDTLKLIMPVEENRQLFYQISLKCQAVVCCRMSPLQKSEIVKMMKNSPLKPVTAAIGDGGNDVAMIQEAHVGIGIMGKEGRAAVRSADFAFAKFCFLRKVILVHGHWYYYRVALLTQYFFYKNVACFTDQLNYAFYSNFSTQTLFDGANLTGYNLLYTALPIFVFALLAQNMDSSKLLGNPFLYRRITRNNLLSKKELFIWFLHGIWHSFAIYFGWVLYWNKTANFSAQHDQMLDQSSFGICVYTSLIILVNLKLLFHARSWNWPLISSMVFSLLVYIGFNFLYHSLTVSSSFMNLFGYDYDTEIMSSVPVNFEMFQVYYHVLSTPGVLLFTLLVVVVALIPDVAIRVIRKHWANIQKRARITKKILEAKVNRGCYEIKGGSSLFPSEQEEYILGRKINPLGRNMSKIHNNNIA